MSVHAQSQDGSVILPTLMESSPLEEGHRERPPRQTRSTRTYKHARALNGRAVERTQIHTDRKGGRKKKNPPPRLPQREIWGHHSLVALKCQDKGGDGARSMFVYLQTGIGSGSDGEWKKKTGTHLLTQNTTSTINASLTEVCVCAVRGRVVRRVLMENNTRILSPMLIFCISHLQVVVTLLTFQAYKRLFPPRGGWTS